MENLFGEKREMGADQHRFGLGTALHRIEATDFVERENGYFGPITLNIISELRQNYSELGRNYLEMPLN